jgi:hypothetical protein
MDKLRTKLDTAEAIPVSNETMAVNINKKNMKVILPRNPDVISVSFLN